MDVIAYCRDRIAPPGSPRYYIERTMPVELRPTYCAIEAFNHDAAAGVLECTDPGIARIKLQWWHEEVARLLAGQPRHPATQAMLQSFARLPEESLQRSLAAIAAQLAGERYGDWNGLLRQMDNLGGARWRAIAAEAGVSDENADRFGNIGQALSLSETIGTLGHHLRQGYCPLPEELLSRHDADGHDVLALDSATAVPLAAEAIAHSRHQLTAALTALPDELRRTHVYAGVAVALEAACLDEIERDGYRLLTHRLRLTPLRCAWVAWRVQRRERRR
jgi:phytoene synthase